MKVVDTFNFFLIAGIQYRGQLLTNASGSSIILLAEATPSVCLSVYLFRISSQTAGWIYFKLSQKMPLASPLKLVDISSRFDKPILHIFGIFYHFLHQYLNWWLSD